MRSALAALLLAFLGFIIGGITFGLSTFWCYGIGSWVGAPIGCALGVWYGLRTPLRDVVILFVTYTLLWVLAVHFLTNLTGEFYDKLGIYVVWLLILGPGGCLIPFVPLHLFSFAQRRTVAKILAIIWGLGFVVLVYWDLWIRGA